MNKAHKYILMLTVTNNRKPALSYNIIVQIPLLNWNVNPPKFQSPVEIKVATDFSLHETLTILNAYDIDGDKVIYSIDPSSDPIVNDTFQLNSLDGSLSLKQSIADIPSSTIEFNVLVRDDGSCCGGKIFYFVYTK